jgi:hypothetical protein
VPYTRNKRRHPLPPITYEELMSNAGMSGFISFLETPQSEPRPVAPAEIAPASVPSPVPKSAPLRAPRRSRIVKANLVEDGHSLAEQAVYEALWKVGQPLTDGDRMVRIGYHRLAQATRLSWVTVKTNLRSLEKKLAIEVVGSENSATREGKCYRVYARTAILERRRLAGLEWVRRTRGVELLSQAAMNITRAGNSALDAEDQDQEETPIPGAHNRPPARLF